MHVICASRSILSLALPINRDSATLLGSMSSHRRSIYRSCRQKRGFRMTAHNNPIQHIFPRRIFSRDKCRNSKQKKRSATVWGQLQNSTQDHRIPAISSAKTKPLDLTWRLEYLAARSLLLSSNHHMEGTTLVTFEGSEQDFCLR